MTKRGENESNSITESNCKKRKLSNACENDNKNKQKCPLTRIVDKTSNGDDDNNALSLLTLHKMSKRMYKREKDRDVKKNEILGIDYDDFRSIYNKYQAIYIPTSPRSNETSSPKEKGKNTNISSNQLTPNDLYLIFESLDEKDKESWCIENELISSINNDENKENKDQTSSTNPGDFLRPMSQYTSNGVAKSTCLKRRQGYCSFIIQNDKQTLNHILDRVPQANLPIFSPNVSKGENDDEVKSNHEENVNKSNKDSKASSITSDSETNVENNINEGYIKPKYGSCLWFFYGLNDPIKRSQDSTSSDSITSTALQGRPEHTDSISHDGTWHYQLSGCKTWYIRPTDALIRLIQEQQEKNLSHETEKTINHTKQYTKNAFMEHNVIKNTGVIRIDCQKGDILLLNTRLWWHRTELPIQESSFGIMNESNDTNKINNDVILEGVASVSYARDIYLPSSFWFDSKKEKSNTLLNGNIKTIDNNDTNGKIEGNNHTMTNVDGLYAANDIEAQTILFTEADMPNCELHRSKTNANCEVVELEDGSSAVVSVRPILSGEFFCVQESSDEEYDEESDDDEESDGAICTKCP